MASKPQNCGGVGMLVVDDVISCNDECSSYSSDVIQVNSLVQVNWRLIFTARC